MIGPGLRQYHRHQMTYDEFTQFVHSSSGVAGPLRTNANVEDSNVVFCPYGPQAQLHAGDQWQFLNTGRGSSPQQQASAC